MILLNSASSAAELVFYLPGVCTHTDTKGKQRKTRVRNILKSLEKTQYLMNTLYIPKKLLLPNFIFTFPLFEMAINENKTGFQRYFLNLMLIRDIMILAISRLITDLFRFFKWSTLCLTKKPRYLRDKCFLCGIISKS